MTGNLRAPERRRFPVSARESPKLKMASYVGGGVDRTLTEKVSRKKRMNLFIVIVRSKVFERGEL